MTRRGGHTYRWWDGTVYRQATFPTKGDKTDFIAEIRRRRRLGLPLRFEPADIPVRLDEFIEDYWRLHAVPNLEASTRANYLQQWSKWIHPRLGPYELGQVTPRVVYRQLVEPMRRAGAGDATVRAALAVLQSVYALAVAEERVEANPVEKVRKPPVVIAHEVPPIAPERVELLRRAVDDVRNAMMIALLGYQGLRPEELLALRADDIAEGGLEVRRKVVDGHLRPYTKTRRNRFVKWTAPLVRRDLLAYQFAAGARAGLLFPRPSDGEPWRKHDWDNWRARVWQPAAAAVGLGHLSEREDKPPLYDGANPYDLRGSFVSLLAWEGQTMLEVARRAGHSLQTCDRHYAGIFEDASMTERVSAEQAIASARERLERGELDTVAEGGAR